MSGLCEEETIELHRCRWRGEDAFEAIVKRYMKDAYFIALGFVGNREDALDLSQEAFFQAYQHIGQLRKGGKFFPWFYQILKNLCLSHLRKTRTRHSQSLDEGTKTKLRDCFDPGVLAERSEIKDKVWKAMGKLDEKHREVIMLRHFQNMSYKQMSDVLFCSIGTVTSRLYHARKKLKEILEVSKGGPHQ